MTVEAGGLIGFRRLPSCNGSVFKSRHIRLERMSSGRNERERTHRAVTRPEVQVIEELHLHMEVPDAMPDAQVLLRVHGPPLHAA